MAAKLPSRRRLRFTGEAPPPELLESIPNWSHCLDEEYVEGQDESTLRPDTEQSFITDDTAATAVVGTDAAGRAVTGLLFCDMMRVGLAESLWIRPGNKGPSVSIYTNMKDDKGAFHGFDELTTAGISLPLRLTTRVPLHPGAAVSRVEITASGSILVNPEPGLVSIPASGAELPFPWPVPVGGYKPLNRAARMEEFREQMVASSRQYQNVLLVMTAFRKFNARVTDDIAILHDRADSALVRLLDAFEVEQADRYQKEAGAHGGRVAKDVSEGWKRELGLGKRLAHFTGADLDRFRRDAAMAKWLAVRGMTILCLREPAHLAGLASLRNKLPGFLSGAARMFAAGKLAAAKRKAAEGFLVVEFVPWSDALQLLVFGPVEQIARLTRAMITDEAMEAHFSGWPDQQIWAVAAHEWAGSQCFASDVDQPLKLLIHRALNAAVNRADHADTAAAGIAAAEVVAARFAGRPLPSGLEEIGRLVRTLAVPDTGLLALARAAVRAVAVGCTCEQATFHTEAARQSWRDGLADLHARLGG